MRTSRTQVGRRSASLARALVLAGVVSFYASGDPDGLTKVSRGQGLRRHRDRARRRRQPAGRLRRHATSTTSASPAVSPVVARRPGRARRRRPESRTPYVGRRARDRSPDDGRRARPQAALPRPLAGPPAPGAPEDPRAAGVHDRRGGDAARLVRRRSRGYLLVLGVVVAISRVPPTYILKRTVVEVPFVVFAVLLPFVATGPRTEVLGVERQRARAARAPGSRCWPRARSACSRASPWPPPPSRRTCWPAWSGCGCPTSWCRSWRSWSATSTWSPARCSG